MKGKLGPAQTSSSIPLFLEAQEVGHFVLIWLMGSRGLGGFVDF